MTSPLLASMASDILNFINRLNWQGASAGDEQQSGAEPKGTDRQPGGSATARTGNTAQETDGTEGATSHAPTQYEATDQLQPLMTEF